MPIEHIEGVDTGIYKVDRVKATCPESMLEFMGAFAEANQIETILDRAEALGLKVISDHGHDDWPIRRTENGWGPNEDDPPIVHDAVSLVGLVRILRERLKAPDEDAIYTALRVGTLRERVYVRLREHYARSGKDCVIGASDGGKKRVARYAANRPFYQAEVDRITQENAAISYDRACKIAAPKFGVHFNTIKAHTENPRKR